MGGTTGIKHLFARKNEGARTFLLIKFSKIGKQKRIAIDSLRCEMIYECHLRSALSRWAQQHDLNLRTFFPNEVTVLQYKHT